jgi:hypothetical protein
MQESIKSLVKLAEDYLAFSVLFYGSKSRTHETGYGKVWCYFDLQTGHKSVDFLQYSQHGITVKFFSPVHIEFNSANFVSEDHVNTLVRTLSEALVTLKSNAEQVSKEEMLAEVQAEKEALRKRLQELESIT